MISSDQRFDNWVRQLTLSALLLAAMALVALAIALYAPRAHAEENTGCIYPSSEREQT